jgi:hypothetical protein
MPDIPEYDDGDVVELILSDHRWFEETLRQLRDETSDRERLRADLSAVLVAHAEAEEAKVYPSLRHKKAIDSEEVEHSEHEHDEGNIALLALLEVEDTGSEEFSDKLHELSEALSHHLDEEERDVLNPARTEVDDTARSRLGTDFATERARLLQDDCGSLESVRKLVAAINDR